MKRRELSILRGTLDGYSTEFKLRRECVNLAALCGGGSARIVAAEGRVPA